MKQYALYFAWVISLVGLGISFYYGEILRFEPCRLCWYQRMSLFPLALLLGIAVFRNDRKFILYALVLAGIGELFALYQLFEHYFPSLHSQVMCGASVNCGESFVEVFHVAAFPVLSAVGFAVIGLLLWAAKKEQ
jgi:disulfide bond formation protein DsbB